MKGHTSFHAKYPGQCQGCGVRYRKGDNIWSPGKDGRAYHITCQPPVELRQATKAEMAQLEMRSRLRKQGIYT